MPASVTYARTHARTYTHTHENANITKLNNVKTTKRFPARLVSVSRSGDRRSCHVRQFGKQKDMKAWQTFHSRRLLITSFRWPIFRLHVLRKGKRGCLSVCRCGFTDGRTYGTQRHLHDFNCQHFPASRRRGCSGCSCHAVVCVLFVAGRLVNVVRQTDVQKDGAVGRRTVTSRRLSEFHWRCSGVWHAIC
jgi:hypothetical protein